MKETFEQIGNKYLLIQSRPCDGQYDYLSIINKDELTSGMPLIEINQNGSGIFIREERLEYNETMKEKDINELVNQIIHKIGIEKARFKDPFYGLQYIIDIYGSTHAISIDNAWESAYYHSGISSKVKFFNFNPLSEADPVIAHLSWWSASYYGKTIAIVNIHTNVCITLSGTQYDLSTNMQQALYEVELLVIIQETKELLFQNEEWQQRYMKYADTLIANLANIKLRKSMFRQWNPLKFYLNYSNAKSSKNSLQVEVRYQGQTVADLMISKNVVLDTKRYDATNMKNFNCNICLSKAPWDGDAARGFRAFFKSKPARINIGKSNDEHRIESQLLTEFLKPGGKMLPNIKPITIGGFRFPMPTPLRASDHNKVKYSGPGGGGIDILARTGKGGNGTHLCIIELKDENKINEPPKQVLKQAVAYSVFIQALLRSASGQKWWNLFGFSGKLPEKLILYAAFIMPDNYIDPSFQGMEIPVDNDIIKLHYAYFSMKNKEITKIDSSLCIINHTDGGPHENNNIPWNS